MSSSRILILGAGFGGVSAALTLDRVAKRHPEIEVVLIDEHDFHQVNADLYEVGTAFFREHIDQAERFRILKQKTVCIPIARILHGKRVHFLKDTVTGTDANTRVVELKDHGRVAFDALIIALGSEANDFGIPGIREYGFTFKTIDDALNLRAHIQNQLAWAKTCAVNERDCHLRFLIGGGGFTGVELAPEIHRLLRHLAPLYDIDPSQIEIRIIEAGPDILLGIDPSVTRIAHSRLKKLGIHVALNTKITEERLKEVRTLQGEEANTLVSQTLIWTAGVRPASVLSRSHGLTLDKGGRVVVDSSLSARADGRVFAIGDNAVVEGVGKIAASAYGAIEQGKIAAHNAFAKLTDGKVRHFHVSPTIFVVPMGGKWAVAKVGKFVFAGYFAWFMKRMIEFHYFVSILPFFEACRRFFVESRIVTQND
ncbi:MAG: NAD(P)/FAD-dependent oxidoreductase [Parcubacteria group bacterium]|nr:NAD(P)/FAD-dependent oxidoreductase [Parcubacteria group bacterium]